eukprot:COSAG04_NODE_3293_length_2967_cov_1.585425_3_plen_248_part_00
MTCLLVTRTSSVCFLSLICPSIDSLTVLTQGTAEEYPPPKGIKPLARTIKPPRLAFAGNYTVRGCYQHTRGLLRGVAFFSLGSCDLDSSTQEEVRTCPTAVPSDDCLTSSRDSSCFERATRCVPLEHARDVDFGPSRSTTRNHARLSCFGRAVSLERDVGHWITRECLSRSTLIQPVTLALRRLCTRGRGAAPRHTGQRPTGRWAWALPPTAARSTAFTTAISPSAPPPPHAGPAKAGSELAVMRFG